MNGNTKKVKNIQVEQTTLLGSLKIIILISFKNMLSAKNVVLGMDNWV